MDNLYRLFFMISITAFFYIMLGLFSSCQSKEEETFHSMDRYDFSTEKYISYLGNFDLIVENDKIIFHPKHGFIDSPLSYSNNKDEFGFNDIYKIENANLNKRYFRFGWTHFSDNKTVFSSIQWLNDSVIGDNDYVEYKISKVSIDYIQIGTISVCTIGDSQTWFNDAQELRMLMNQYDSNLKFTGSSCDIYGYPHEGEGGNGTAQLLNRISKVPKADYFSLLIGTNDWQRDIGQTSSNILTILQIITSKYSAAKIVYLSPIPTTHLERDTFNKALYQMVVDSLKNKGYASQIIQCDLGGKMRENMTWSRDYLTSDGLHQNKNGVNFMAEVIANEITKYYKHP